MSVRSFGASIGSKAAHTFAARILASALSVLTGIIIARLLGPQGKGVYSGVQTLLAIPVAITGGAGAAITYLMTKQRRSINDLFPTLTAAFGLAMLATLAACAAYAGLRGWSMEMTAFLLAMPPSILLSWQQPYYMAVDLVRRLNVQNVLVALFTLTGTAVVCLVFRLGIFGAFAAWLTVLYAVAAVILVDMIRSGARLHRRDFATHLRAFARVGGQSALNSGLGLLNYRIDSILLIALLGVPVFGVYSIAVSLGEMLFLIARSVNTAIGREVGMADPARAAQTTALVVRANFTFCLLCAVPIALFAPPLVHAVYGARFDGAALPLRLLLPGIVAFATAGTFASYFIFQLGRPSAVTIINVAMIGVQVTGCFVLVPRLGSAGAAIASSLAYVAGAFVNTVLFCRISRISPATLWIARRSDVRRLGDIIRELLPFKRQLSAAPAPVVLTGAAGAVAQMLREPLGDRYPMLLTDRKRPRNLRPGERFVRADLRSFESIRGALRGARAVIHFGGASIAGESFESVLQANIRGTYNLLEAARVEGVKRVILASTGHVTGFYPRCRLINEDAPPRPDTLYGFSKACVELLGRYFADKFGMEVLCLRIGHVLPSPEYEIDKHIWLSPRDLMQLLRIGIESTDITFETVYAVSDNPARFWSLERARSLGYEPHDAAVASTHPLKGELKGLAALFQGETFAAGGFTGTLPGT